MEEHDVQSNPKEDVEEIERGEPPNKRQRQCTSTSALESSETSITTILDSIGISQEELETSIKGNFVRHVCLMTSEKTCVFILQFYLVVFIYL